MGEVKSVSQATEKTKEKEEKGRSSIGEVDFSRNQKKKIKEEEEEAGDRFRRCVWDRSFEKDSETDTTP